eukprot:9369831-Karenia_brevis.AAC.1
MAAFFDFDVDELVDEIFEGTDVDEHINVYEAPDSLWNSAPALHPVQHTADDLTRDQPQRTAHHA